MTQRRRRKSRQLNPDNLAPEIAAGISRGSEPVPETPTVLSGVEAVRHMADASSVGRVPLPRFVAEEAPSELVVQTYVEYPDGRKFLDPIATFRPEAVDAMRMGAICLRCLEPQGGGPVEDHLPGCEGVDQWGAHYIRDRQGLDLALEFVGDRHIGPAKPLSEYLAEREMEAEQRAFARKQLEGASPMRGLRG